MPARPAKPCEDAAYLIPGLPISMAAMNLLYALAFAVLLGVAAVARQERRMNASVIGACPAIRHPRQTWRG